MKPIESDMNIKPTRADLNQGSQRAGSTSEKSRTDSRDGASSTGQNDSVTLTSAATEMLKLEASLSQIPDIDSQRVNAIKTAIADGQYQVDTDKIVSKLLQTERDLL